VAIFFTAKGGRISVSRLSSHVWKRKNFSPKEAIFSTAKLPHPEVVKISARRIGKALME
jgi:hypothetical protein